MFCIVLTVLQLNDHTTSPVQIGIYTSQPKSYFLLLGATDLKRIEISREERRQLLEGTRTVLVMLFEMGAITVFNCGFFFHLCSHTSAVDLHQRGRFFLYQDVVTWGSMSNIQVQCCSNMLAHWCNRKKLSVNLSCLQRKVKIGELLTWHTLRFVLFPLWCWCCRKMNLPDLQTK